MKASFLKKIEHQTPDAVKKLIAPIIRNKVIKDSRFVEQYQELQLFDKKTKSEQEHLHFQLLKSRLQAAYKNSTYYHQLFEEIDFNPDVFKDMDELKRIPFIDKKTVMNYGNQLVSNQPINYYLAHTGGSTGSPLEISLSSNIPYKERAFVYSYWHKSLGYQYKKDKIISFRGLEFNNKIYKYNPIDQQLIFSPFKLSDTTINEYVKKINHYAPDFIHGYPSAITKFCKLLASHHIKLNKQLKGVFLVSENLMEYERAIIETTLNCRISIFYGHSERIAFGEYDEHLGYSFHPLYGHVDLIPYRGNFYHMHFTGFLNEAMYMINYRPDDLLELNADGKVMIHGHHEKEMLYGINGEEISVAALNFHNEAFEKVTGYQFEQFERGKILIRIEDPAGDLTKKDISKIDAAFNSKLESIIDYELMFVQKIELTNRGKLNKIIQHT